MKTANVGLIGTMLAGMLAGASVFANPYYVDASRPDDSGDGLSWATAKKTIQAAVDLAAGGETVRGVDPAGGGQDLARRRERRRSVPGRARQVADPGRSGVEVSAVHSHRTGGLAIV